MAKFENKEIDGRKYKIMLLTPMAQTLFAAQVAQCLAPVLKAGGLNLDELKEAAHKTPEKLLPMLAGVLPDLDAEKIHKLSKQALLGNLFAGETKINTEEELNQYLEEYPKDSFKLIIWSIGANVGVFFG